MTRHRKLAQAPGELQALPSSEPRAYWTSAACVFLVDGATGATGGICNRTADLTPACCGTPGSDIAGICEAFAESVGKVEPGLLRIYLCDNATSQPACCPIDHRP